jgi:D-alanyl-D-alanine carboxypeptidase/D-alanyl-D-alanine-endopeptidase (penicillin-binding protein 4)
MRRTPLLGLLGAAFVVAATATPVPAAAAQAPELPAAIRAIMDKPRYGDARWSMLVADVKSGKTLYALDPDRLSLSGSTRKLFSVGVALDALGARHRQLTPVHRRGRVDGRGALHGDLVLVGGGDLAFGGRRLGRDGIEYTDFDHNDANNLGTAILTRQDPLFALNALARQVRASGIRTVRGNVAVDDRLFEPYRVPNGNLLITPMMVNENMVDVTVAPTAPGRPAKVTYRPATAAFRVNGTVGTAPAGAASSLSLSGRGLIDCIGRPGCSGTVAGALPFGYRAPLSGIDAAVGTFRVENPAAFARTAFVEALRRQGVKVQAPTVGRNPRGALPRRLRYPAGTRVALHRSAPYAQLARLVLKVSLNLGANLSLSLFGLDHDRRTVKGALAAERRTLVKRFGIAPGAFRFPTNGSGTPDSEATPRALVQMLRGMSRTRVARAYARGLPVLGKNGSLAHTGTTLPARGHVRAKTGTTIMPGADGETIELKAQNMAGYITTKSGRRLAYALMVNDVGAITDIETDVAGVFQDEAEIANVIYERVH